MSQGRSPCQNPTRLLNSALIPAFVSCTIPARGLGGALGFQPCKLGMDQLSQAFWGWLLRTLEIEGTDVGLREDLWLKESHARLEQVECPCGHALTLA